LPHSLEAELLTRREGVMKSVLWSFLLLLAVSLICSPFMFADAAADYKAKCAACHGASGAGDTTMGKNLKLKDLGSADVQKMSDEELVTTISKGKGKMPAYDGKLSKDQINDLVKLVRSWKK
jgi:mono/diheme cytochrome c family protein